MEELQVFNFDKNEIRTTVIKGEPWFIGKDVAMILGYSNPRDAINKHVDDEDKGVAKCDTLGGKQNLTIVNESGLYALVFGSKLPQAKKFKHWVTSEVLPALRKTGGYKMPRNFADALREYAMQVEENEKLMLENKMKDQQLAELKPKADYCDTILKSKSLITMNAIAKDYGMSAVSMNKTLHDLGVQYKQGTQWFLYSKYQNCGYTQSQTISIERSDGKPDTVLNTKWTQKGRLFLYNLLKANGIIPMIER